MWPLPIPKWKWEHITMDSVDGLPKSLQGYDSVWVIVDRVTKSAHFLRVKVNFSLNKLAELCTQEIVRLHGFLHLLHLTKILSLLHIFGRVYR